MDHKIESAINSLLTDITPETELIKKYNWDILHNFSKSDYINEYKKIDFKTLSKKYKNPKEKYPEINKIIRSNNNLFINLSKDFIEKEGEEKLVYNSYYGTIYSKEDFNSIDENYKDMIYPLIVDYKLEYGMFMALNDTNTISTSFDQEYIKTLIVMKNANDMNACYIPKEELGIVKTILHGSNLGIIMFYNKNTKKNKISDVIDIQELKNSYEFGDYKKMFMNMEMKKYMYDSENKKYEINNDKKNLIKNSIKLFNKYDLNDFSNFLNGKLLKLITPFNVKIITNLYKSISKGKEIKLEYLIYILSRIGFKYNSNDPISKYYSDIITNLFNMGKVFNKKNYTILNGTFEIYNIKNKCSYDYDEYYIKKIMRKDKILFSPMYVNYIFLSEDKDITEVKNSIVMNAKSKYNICDSFRFIKPSHYIFNFNNVDVFISEDTILIIDGVIKFNKMEEKNFNTYYYYYDVTK